LKYDENLRILIRVLGGQASHSLPKKFNVLIGLGVMHCATPALRSLVSVHRILPVRPSFLTISGPGPEDIASRLGGVQLTDAGSAEKETMVDRGNRKTPAWLWRRLQASLSEVGLIYTLQVITKRLVPSSVLQWAAFATIEYCWDDWTDDGVPQTGLRLADPDNAQDCAQLAAVSAWQAKRALKLLCEGAIVVLHDHDGAVTGLSVYAPHPVNHLEWMRLENAPDILCIVDVWVAESERGRGLAMRMRSFAIRRLRKAGFRGTMSNVEMQNYPSLRGGLKSARLTGYYNYFRILKWTLMWRNGQFQFGSWGPARRFLIHSADPDKPAASRFGPYKPARLERYITADRTGITSACR